VERFDQVIESAGRPSVILNIGRGDGVTVRELVSAFERVSGHEVPLTEAAPRPGDAVGAFANVDRATELLDWRTELSIDEGIASALAWADRRQEVLGYE
jgi:UDP-glucose 4-epimerase